MNKLTTNRSSWNWMSASRFLSRVQRYSYEGVFMNFDPNLSLFKCLCVCYVYVYVIFSMMEICACLCSWRIYADWQSKTIDWSSPLLKMWRIICSQFLRSFAIIILNQTLVFLWKEWNAYFFTPETSKRKKYSINAINSADDYTRPMIGIALIPDQRNAKRWEIWNMFEERKKRSFNTLSRFVEVKRNQTEETKRQGKFSIGLKSFHYLIRRSEFVVCKTVLWRNNIKPNSSSGVRTFQHMIECSPIFVNICEKSIKS